jgi:hypothetical protein
VRCEPFVRGLLRGESETVVMTGGLQRGLDRRLRGEEIEGGGGWAAQSHHTEEKGGPDRWAAVAGSAPKPVGASGIWTGEVVRGPLTRGRRPQCWVLNPSTGSNHLTEFDFKF